jgi:hypothetical protein
MQQTKQPLGTAIRYRYLDMLDWIEHQNISIIGAALVLMAIVSGSALVGRVRSDARAAAVSTAQLPIVIRVYQGLWYTARSQTKGANRNATLRN